jgi:type II secretion system protein C
MSLLLALLVSALPPDLAAVGVVVSPRQERSVAILASGGQSRVAAIGETAFGGRVAAISANGVSLDFGGERVELPLQAGATRVAMAPPAAVPSAAAAAPAAGLSLPRKEMDRRLGTEMNRILAETALRPAMDGDDVKGLVLSRVPDGTLLTDAGLRSGDVLTEINGVPIDSLATLIGLYGRLQTETHVEATVLRNGEPVSLSLNLR